MVGGQFVRRESGADNDADGCVFGERHTAILSLTHGW